MCVRSGSRSATERSLSTCSWSCTAACVTSAWAEHVGHLVGDRIRIDRNRHGAEPLRGRHGPVEARPVVADRWRSCCRARGRAPRGRRHRRARSRAPRAQVQDCQMPRSLCRNRRPVPGARARCARSASERCPQVRLPPSSPPWTSLAPDKTGAFPVRAVSTASCAEIVIVQRPRRGPLPYSFVGRAAYGGNLCAKACWVIESHPANRLCTLRMMLWSTQDIMARTDQHDRFDYIIVGAGSAGCVLANRLSADPRQPGAGARGRRPRPLDLVPHPGRLSVRDRQSARRLDVHDGRRAGAQRPRARLPARQGDRRLVGHQRHDLHARPGGRLRRLAPARPDRLGLGRRAARIS